ncbi:hypothetical protein GALMADRAFT_238956 [Galerina marginata CBS 339.88]|uniref:F-box domain-containing protein n=1 Tax=Galerina marginata (strain CBS 339.88) TaxID=685588 RepID=A0A067TIS7_GALM3|nr:hypothetical protein GALMADRAFT_238956 [Galerina marginata CBS 339.88]
MESTDIVMQPHLAKFLENNICPSEEDLKEVKEVLSMPLQELQDKATEIERLSKALNDLKEERKVIQNSVDEYTTILSPVRRFSTRILHEIFLHCLPSHRNPVMSATEAPLLLAQICQSWRSAALSCHPLWSRLHVPLLPYSNSTYEPFSPNPGVDTTQLREEHRELPARYAKAMQTRSELAEIWLSRSGSCPLSISINFFGYYGPVLQEDLNDDNPLFQLFTTIIAFSERFDDLELCMPFEIYQALQDKISLEMVPNLRRLRTNFFERVTPNANMPRHSVILLEAPKLQKLSMYTDNVSVATFDAVNIPSTWENLTDLFFHSPITSAEAVQVLRKCQNLEHCKLVVSDGADVYISPDDVLSLPYLRFLCIQLNTGDSMAVIYRRINAPNLTSFEYQSYHRFPQDYGHGMNGTTQSSPVLSLLERCRGMRKLSVDPRIWSAQDLIFSFRIASNLTHLILGQPPRDGQALVQEFSQGNGPYWMVGFGHFNLDLLVISEQLTATPFVLIPEKEILLPKLEVFEAFLTGTVTDDTLLQFILSRLGDPAHKGVTSLKTVKVAFERTRQKDICDEVHQRAEEVGLKIALDLFYSADIPPNNTKYTDVLSPWYGLSEDRSWHYPDDEAEES